MNQLTTLLTNKREKILSIFFTAGYPEISSTSSILQSLQKHGVDLVEVGIPYSDPLADGPVIQQTSTKAIANGMTVDTLFAQLDELKGKITIPMVLMGYLNPVLQYGVERFCKRAQAAGVSGVILPDMPLEVYEETYRAIFSKHGLHVIFLVSPNTKPERIRRIDELSTSFIYAVSSSATTGKQSGFGAEQTEYLVRLQAMKLRSPILVGFGIHSSETLNAVWGNAQGAIIGTAYVKLLSDFITVDEAIVRLKKQLGL